MSTTVFVYGDLAALAMGVLVGVPSAWVLLRAPWQCVRVDERGVALHGLGRTRRVWWNDVDAVRLERIDERLELGVDAPALVLSDGQLWPLTLLAGYSTRGRAPLTRMAGQASAIERLRPS